MNFNKQLLTTQELATLLGCSPRTLEGLRVRGSGIPYVKVSRLVRYRATDVQRYLDGQRRESTSDASEVAR